jgi:hypothetical protein
LQPSAVKYIFMLGINAGLKLITKLFCCSRCYSKLHRRVIKKYIEFVGHRDVLGERARMCMFLSNKQFFSQDAQAVLRRILTE